MSVRCDSRMYSSSEPWKVRVKPTPPLPFLPRTPVPFTVARNIAGKASPFLCQTIVRWQSWASA